MPFDASTRNRLQRFVNEARKTLEEEFTRQLQGDYGLDPLSGSVTPLDSLRHLNDAQRETARILRGTLAHYCASSHVSEAVGLERIVREQSFTVLNRLAALRMAEARGLLIESVANGYQAKGFQVYARLAGTGLGETGEAYRTYLLSVCDELAEDLPGLFDRFSPQGRLFPRESALLSLLTLVNDPDLDRLWVEDETIGWIYQYFNSKEERKAMRDASQAPRNSRELAVRNQFFTPRYVVEFLVDNTLGRLWVEMTQGQTPLRERCRYLLCGPNDVFLGSKASEEAPFLKRLLRDAGASQTAFDTTDEGIRAMVRFAHCVDPYARHPQTWGEYFQELQPILREQRFAEASTQQLWDGLFLECRADRHGGYGEIYREPWFINTSVEIVRRLTDTDANSRPKLVPSRRMRDPRTLKLLDPACGSMHFGLYAFDLFEDIYHEAWAWEQQHGPGSLSFPSSPVSEGPGESGQDCKPLCQSYEDEAAFRRDVPRLILEHNLYGVDIDPRAAQIASLALWLRAQRAWHDAGVNAKDRPPVGQSGHVVAAVAPPAERELSMQLAARLDTRDAELFERTLKLLKGLPELGVLLPVERELPHLIRQVYVGTGTGLFAAEERENWQQAEHRLREALTEFAHAAKATYQGRLFAQDALQGLQLIDLCREVFDVVVMNPPFGALANGTKEALAKAYPKSKNDLLAIFVERGLQLLRVGGRLGAITSRTCFFLSSFQKWREDIVLGVAEPEVMADLGHGVMDDAMVEAAAYCLVKR